MSIKTLTMPEDVVINMLKTIPKDELVDIFWKTLVEADDSPLTLEERKEIEEAKIELDKGETVKWENLR